MFALSFLLIRATFDSCRHSDIPQGTYPIEKLIDGAIGFAVQTTEIGIESALDFEAAMPLIYPQQAILFQTDDEYYEISQTQSSEYSGFWNSKYITFAPVYCLLPLVLNTLSNGTLH